jgi:hypothetical protein
MLSIISLNYFVPVQNVWDRYDYGRDTNWYRATGYPLMKAVAEYWIHEMVPDLYWKDGTLVAAPCNSPEHGWTVRQNDMTLVASKYVIY